MTGPDINRFQTDPLSNSIGRFVIGISPIGTIEPFDVWETVISQYANSPILMQLILNFDAYLDQTQNLDNFIGFMRDISSASGYGLIVWGNIVGVTNVLQIVGTQKYFGFEEATPISADPFGPGGQSSFYSGTPLTSNFTLSDDAFRLLILAKALANLSNGSIDSINQILISLFPNRGNAFGTDGLNMTGTYTFNFILTPVELAIVEQSGVLPKPTGVNFTVVQAV
jgi:hypothetical protein